MDACTEMTIWDTQGCSDIDLTRRVTAMLWLSMEMSFPSGLLKHRLTVGDSVTLHRSAILNQISLSQSMSFSLLNSSLYIRVD